MLALAFRTDGEREKFEYIYAKYKNLMLRKAFAILRDQMLAEDAVSEAFIRVYKNIGKIDDPASNSAIAFVATITKNCALTLLRKRGGQPAEALPDEIGGGVEPEAYVIEKLSSEEIYRLINRLGEEDKNIFLLKFAYGMSHKEIGRTLGMAENNVTVRLHRTRKKLGAMVQKSAAVEGNG
ncbi:MAG: sigma-70 family RNA polymerase sigma factor [Clostridiales bacterium]|nr:sigma-70 family RNA polymerase sigma factor [Clostridiales bacterium]